MSERVVFTQEEDAQNTTCHLLALASELRNYIWELVFTPDYVSGEGYENIEDGNDEEEYSGGAEQDSESQDEGPGYEEVDSDYLVGATGPDEALLLTCR